MHEDVAVPCFLKDVCRLIFRAGQQLQLLVKMLEFFDCHFTGIDSCSEKPFSCSGLSNLEVILPFWNRSSHKVFYSSLSFRKQCIEGLVAKRNIMYNVMEERCNRFFLELNTRARKRNGIVRIILLPSWFLGISSNSVKYVCQSHGTCCIVLSSLGVRVEKKSG